VKHLIWSTLPNVEAISGGKFNVPHSTGKANVDRIVKAAGFAHHTFVIAPFYYENLLGALASQKKANGSLGWALPLSPNVRCIHMGDIRELGDIVAGAFAHPDQVGHGEYLPLVGDFMSFNEIVDTASDGSPSETAATATAPTNTSERRAAGRIMAGPGGSSVRSSSDVFR
jgi:uncharacterized protein YbjT (DUF2867 family)